MRRLPTASTMTVRRAALSFGSLVLLCCGLRVDAEVWPRHVIDDSSRGADGVRLADFNADGRLDIVTGWEEGGITRVYLQPPADEVRRPWPAVTVGPAPSVEDAVAVDLDGDGQLDVVSSTEGRHQSLIVHWAPNNAEALLNPKAWKTEAFPASVGAQQWMYCLPMQIDGKAGVDLVTGSKGPNAEVGWWQSPADPRDLKQWKYHKLIDAGWIMSLIADDFDFDGDADILVTDRRGNASGVKWLAKPDPSAVTVGDAWVTHMIGGVSKEVMFANLVDLDFDGMRDVLVITRNRTLDIFRRVNVDSAPLWSDVSIANPFGYEHGKSLVAADFDRDGQLEIATTTRPVPTSGPALALLRQTDGPFDSAWTASDIGGPDGSKFDLLEAIDVDRDGDLDLITCEEVANLGVVWYENPLFDD